MREMASYLESDLFERVSWREVEDGNPDYGYWRSPLGWLVVFSLRKDKTGYTGEIRRPDGDWYAATSYADIHWLEDKLP
jgi:hypothetical protein